MLLLFTIAFISVYSRDINNAYMTELELGVHFNSNPRLLRKGLELVFSHLILTEFH